MSQLSKLIAGLPAILLMVFMNVLITFTLAGLVMMELVEAFPNSYFPLTAAVLIAVIVYSWISFNYKLRNYITKLGDTDE